MNLVLDIGNSSAKFGVFQDSQMIGGMGSVAHEKIVETIKHQNPKNMIVSAVGKYEETLPALPGTTIYLTSMTPLPITLNYNTQESLGVDRIAAAVGAAVLHPGNDSLIIDAGSCITYDLLTGGKIFQGGIISPGVRLRTDSMHTLTKDLPLISLDDSIGKEVPFIGKSTLGSMQSGVLHGMLGEINSIVEKYQEKSHNIRVYLCGGEAKYFEKRLKASIFAVPELVLVGLNKILEHNIS